MVLFLPLNSVPLFLPYVLQPYKDYTIHTSILYILQFQFLNNFQIMFIQLFILFYLDSNQSTNKACDIIGFDGTAVEQPTSFLIF